MIGNEKLIASAAGDGGGMKEGCCYLDEQLLNDNDRGNIVLQKRVTQSRRGDSRRVRRAFLSKGVMVFLLHFRAYLRYGSVYYVS